jgi:hypothetical protein
MPKQAISVTLESDNVTWLKGRAGAAGVRSVSELVDRLVTEARQAGRLGPSRSVVGTIDIDSSDPMLEGADAAVRAVYESSLRRPFAVRERRTGHRDPSDRSRSGAGRRGPASPVPRAAAARGARGATRAGVGAPRVKKPRG